MLYFWPYGAGYFAAVASEQRMHLDSADAKRRNYDRKQGPRAAGEPKTQVSFGC